MYLGGDLVTLDGTVYEAQWWTTDRPGTSVWGSWMEHGATVSCSIGDVASWTPSMVYLGGDTVAHLGQVYDAKWWTRNQQPGDPWGPWQPVGSC